MRPENCVTRNHIEVYHARVLPPAPHRIGFRTVLRGSLLPLLIWSGVALFTYVVLNPVVTTAFAGVFIVSFAVGFRLRRRGSHSVRCSAYGAVGGVFNQSMEVF
ncbi:hypothetical protein [Streptomyces californicus]|uniref:hypothetical protein n=1 Tax=Streptomyces californicus TaxID=67351 RepID=UPI0037A2B2E1